VILGHTAPDRTGQLVVETDAGSGMLRRAGAALPVPCERRASPATRLRRSQPTTEHSAQVRLVRAATGELQSILPGHAGEVRDASSKNATHHSGAASNAVCSLVWQRRNCFRAADPLGPRSRDAALQRKVRSVALSPEGDTLVSGGSDNFAQAAALPGIPRRFPGTPPDRLHPLDHDVAANAKPQRMPSGTHALCGRCGTLRVSRRRPCGASCFRRAARQAPAGSTSSGGRPCCSGRARRCRACAFRQPAARQRPPAACRDPCSAPRDGGSGS
jgi:hypothetical protein